MIALAKNYFLPAVLMSAGLTAACFLTSYLALIRPQLPAEHADSDLSMNGSRLKGFLFGAEGLVADWYFMRSLQYIGDKILAAKEEDVNLDDLSNLNPRLLYPMLGNATDLDPHFMAAYSYGSVVLPAIDEQQAIALAEKGIANNPNQWRLHQYLGYVYWRIGNYEKAAEIYEKGSLVRDSSPFMKLMSAAMKTRGGSRETARFIYNEMMTSDDPQVRITARRRLLELDSLDERDAVNIVLDEERQRTGRCPADLREILPRLRTVEWQFRVDAANNLVDPAGTAYLLDQSSCKMVLDRERTGIPTQ